MLVWCFAAFGACHCKVVDLLGDACLVVGGASRLQRHDLHFPPETSFAVDMFDVSIHIECADGLARLQQLSIWGWFGLLLGVRIGHAAVSSSCWQLMYTQLHNYIHIIRSATAE